MTSTWSSSLRTAYNLAEGTTRRKVPEHCSMRRVRCPYGMLQATGTTRDFSRALDEGDAALRAVGGIRKPEQIRRRGGRCFVEDLIAGGAAPEDERSHQRERDASDEDRPHDQRRPARLPRHFPVQPVKKAARRGNEKKVHEAALKAPVRLVVGILFLPVPVGLSPGRLETHLYIIHPALLSAGPAR